MLAPELFKGASFMNLDIGKPTGLEYRIEYPSGKVVVDDPKGIEIVDGEFQAEKDWEHRAKEVNEWLKVEPLDMPDDLCIIGFRGEEYKIFPDLYLPTSYWEEAILQVLKNNNDMRFRVVTDDIEGAKEMFMSTVICRFLQPSWYSDVPDEGRIEITHDIGMDWRSIRYAKHLIIANSSFYILPAWLNRWENGTQIIAPKFWAGHNKGVWQLPENQYEGWDYI